MYIYNVSQFSHLINLNYLFPGGFQSRKGGENQRNTPCNQIVVAMY